jgi:hypothetical protein
MLGAPVVAEACFVNEPERHGSIIRFSLVIVQDSGIMLTVQTAINSVSELL